MSQLMNAVFFRTKAPVNGLARLTAMTLLCLLASFATAQQVNSDAIKGAEILNLGTPEADVFSSGQPTQEQLQLLADSGVKHIINLRAAGEQDWDEGAYVESLGMQYHNIPVAGVAGVTSDNAKRLDDLLNSLDGQPTLVHCASSLRVGALRAIAASEIDGESLESAMATGASWGLGGGLEGIVRTKLSE